ncbi:hypothetical protein, partial [Escherichia coli]|uniref:hypothetical protein n=1 Tax=Escherichia coli TaxID=562 RepID=UPI00129011CB
MADYKVIKDFYEDNKAYMTTDEVLAFENFFSKYKSEDDFLDTLARASIDVDADITFPEVERDFSGLKSDLKVEDMDDYT